MKIQMDFIPAEMMSRKNSREKLDTILKRVKKNIIVVLEKGLDPREEAELIETTMGEIDSKDFFGIEFYRIDHQGKGMLNRLSKYMPEKMTGVLNRYIAKKESGLTIVGPTRMVEAIKKKSDYITMFAKVGE